MEHNPYEVPAADLAVDTEQQPVKSPLIIKFTIVLLVIMFGLGLYGFAGIFYAVMNDEVHTLQKGLLFGLLYQTAVVAITASLFMGIWRRKAWGRWGSIIVGLYIIAISIYTVIATPQDTDLTLANKSAELIGQYIMLAIIALYPLRLFLSKKMKAYFAS